MYYPKMKLTLSLYQVKYTHTRLRNLILSLPNNRHLHCLISDIYSLLNSTHTPSRGLTDRKCSCSFFFVFFLSQCHLVFFTTSCSGADWDLWATLTFYILFYNVCIFWRRKDFCRVGCFLCATLSLVLVMNNIKFVFGDLHWQFASLLVCWRAIWLLSHSPSTANCICFTLFMSTFQCVVKVLKFASRTFFSPSFYCKTVVLWYCSWKMFF